MGVFSSSFCTLLAVTQVKPACLLVVQEMEPTTEFCLTEHFASNTMDHRIQPIRSTPRTAGSSSLCSAATTGQQNVHQQHALEDDFTQMQDMLLVNKKSCVITLGVTMC